MKTARWVILLLPLFWAGCSLLRWSGHHVQEDMGPSKALRMESGLSPNPGLGKAEPGERPLEIRVSTGPARP